MNTLIVGCGYIGGRIAEGMLRLGHAVTATSRSPNRLSRIRDLGGRTVTLELSSPDESPVFDESFDAVVYAVAPGRGGDAQVAFRDGIALCLERWRERPPGKFVLLSSTGVYNQTDGAWIDEDSPIEPRTQRQELLAAGERLLLEAATAGRFPAVVLRLGGLYGPGRSPVAWCGDEQRREQLSQGTSEAFMSWLHADDAATAARLAIEKGRPGEVYLVVDNEPVRRQDFYDFACACAGTEALELRHDPERIAKRCSNAKARRELGFEPLFPTYREGLRALTPTDDQMS